MPKILLVEDDINLREIYAARLSAEGYELTVASDGEEALSKAVAEKPNLILLDVMMPKISGFDVLDILRSTPETKNTKVIMLSALSQQSDRERGEKLGADKYLIKSQITLEDVVDTVKSMVEGGSNDSNSTPIVTTAGGRLPGDEPSNPKDKGIDKEQILADNRPNINANTGSVSGSDSGAMADSNAATDSGTTVNPGSQTADEIAHIDSVMQQDQDDSKAV